MVMDGDIWIRNAAPDGVKRADVPREAKPETRPSDPSAGLGIPCVSGLFREDFAPRDAGLA